MADSEKVWFLEINGKKEGPFSFYELKRHPLLTPDTLAWKKGFKKWVPVRAIAELQELFEDEEEGEDERVTKIVKSPLPEDEVVLRTHLEPPFFFFWALVAAVSMLYAIYYYYYFL